MQQGEVGVAAIFAYPAISYRDSGGHFWISDTTYIEGDPL